jgi:hypothetical protein
MATRRALLAALSGAVFAGTARAQQTVLLQERKETKMKITRAFSGPSKGPAEYFTGSVQIHSRYQGDAPARIGVPLSLSSPAPAPHGTRIRLDRL